MDETKMNKPTHQDARAAKRSHFLATGEGCECQECHHIYQLDLIVPDEVWKRISDGKSLLCAECIGRRLELTSDFGAFFLTDPAPHPDATREAVRCSKCGIVDDTDMTPRTGSVLCEEHDWQPLSSVRPVPWVSVEDRLPDDDRPVFVTVDAEYNAERRMRFVEIQGYCEGEWETQDVSAWMPLPAPFAAPDSSGGTEKGDEIALCTCAIHRNDLAECPRCGKPYNESGTVSGGRHA